MTKENIYISGHNYGEIGKKVPGNLHCLNEDLYIGDIVSFIWDGKVNVGTVLNKESANTYGIYGYWFDKLDLTLIKKIYDYRHISNSVKVNSILTENKNIEIKENDIRELTIEEVQRLLGYKIKIVK